MAVTSPQTFGTDYILQKLVDYFNGLSPTARTINPSDLPLYKIVVVAEAEDQPVIIVGDQSTTVPSANYLGEATYLWIGPRGAPATATAASFFEVAKFVNTAGGSGAVNVVSKEATFIGTLPLPDITPPMPLLGDYNYAVRLTAAYADGWFGDQIVFEVDGTEYAFELKSDGEYSFVFGANTGTTVAVTYAGGGANGIGIEMVQFASGETPASPSAITIISETDLDQTATPLVNFAAPFFLISYDAQLTNSQELLGFDRASFGGSITTNSSLTRLAVTDLYGDGYTTIYNNSALVGYLPNLEYSDEIASNNSLDVRMDATGGFVTTGFDPSTGAPQSYFHNGSYWVWSQLPGFSGYAATHRITTAPDGTPTMFVGDSSNGRIGIYHHNGTDWTFANQINKSNFAPTAYNNLAVSADGRMLVHDDSWGYVWAKVLQGDNWQTGSIAHVPITSLIGTGQVITSLSVNSNYDVAIGYRDSFNITRLAIFGNVMDNQTTAPKLAEISVTDTPITNVISCEFATTSLSNPGFMATTKLGGTPVVVWLSPDLGMVQGNWPASQTTTPANVMVLPAKPGLGVSNPDATAIIPAKLYNGDIKLIAGLAADKLVEFWEYQV